MDGNKVFLEGFEYSPQNNIFRSVGKKIEIRDNKQNNYNFSQIYRHKEKRDFRYRYKSIFKSERI